jgi:diaminohydroxyphosphoribosylaminopyrimidine deaminase/5-amino-6-(5-phosphoribosylamino)uracil reductase
MQIHSIFTPLMAEMHDIYMKRALDLASRSDGNAGPNPMVGAVLVHEGRIIGEGYHKEYGLDHAEINCLDSVAESDKHLIPQSSMYVNLEPCAHYGKTPPCALRLVHEKVKEVIIANDDPFEEVDGRGLEILKSNHIHTEVGVLDKEGYWLNRRFFCFHQNKRPYIVLKWAQTAEGYFAPLDRTRYQITGIDTRQLVHKWRTEESAILVGYQTALNDNPELTARMYSGRQPLRVIFDRTLQLPHTHNVFNSDAPTWIINDRLDKEEGNIRYISIKFNENPLTQILEKLQEANKLSLIVEGGAMLLESFIAEGLWDEARVFTGEASMTEGVHAPLLTDFKKAFESQLGGDTLNVYVNRSSRYKYVPGMEL